MSELYTPDKLGEAVRLEANTLAISVFLNDGKGGFVRRNAPDLAQLAPVMSIDIPTSMATARSTACWRRTTSFPSGKRVA